MSAPPPEDPDGPRDRRDLDFDAEFERIVADFGPAPMEADTSSSDLAEGAPIEEDPPDSADRADRADDSLRNLFRSAWPDETPRAPEPDPSMLDPVETPEEHFVPPPAPPIPRPEPRRLLAWAGLLGAPLVGLAWLVLGSLPTFGSFLLFCWFVGGFGYLVATMKDGGSDEWDDGARV